MRLKRLNPSGDDVIGMVQQKLRRMLEDLS